MDTGRRDRLIPSAPRILLRMSIPRLLAVALAGSLALTACGGDDGDDGGGGGGDEANVAVGPADEGIDGVVTIRVPDNTHTESVVDYGLQPPAGGAHNQVWLNCGFYDAPSPDENIVHSLEHGAVWLAYSPDLDAAQIDVIHELARANAKVVATPYPDLPEGAAVVATAWARQLTLDTVSDDRLGGFVVQYQDGSQAPEAGVTCADSSLGTPIP